MGTLRSNWVSTLSDCLAQLEREQVGSACPVVDHEVGQGSNGSAEDMTAWLICRNHAEQRAFTDTEMPRVVSALRKRMLATGFPETAVSSLQVRVTSRDEVNQKGYGGLRV